MYIKEIELNNFRIYKGKNVISLLPSDDKNVIVISGKNGFGKTTFLMSLVWCLYGKQMEKVDDLYEKEIRDKGNYTKYISESLNRKAREEGDKAMEKEYNQIYGIVMDLPIKKYGSHSALNMFTEYSMTDMGALAEYGLLTEKHGE